jgi:hypothetical protein
MDRRTLDWNLWMGIMLGAFADEVVRGSCIPSVFVEGKFRPPTKKRSEETEFSVEVSPFQSCVGVQR